MVALIGVVGLAGIAVNDATILVDFINRRCRAGMPLREAILASGRLRFRPVLLTTITTVCGLLPLALDWRGGSDTLKPMALAICWGLSFCTVLTLVVVPCLYVCVTWLAARVVPGFLRRAINKHPPEGEEGDTAP
jgi:multidrug efflux pump subunit AcrB